MEGQKTPLALEKLEGNHLREGSDEESRKEQATNQKEKAKEKIMAYCSKLKPLLQ
jgi:hypothetical protein